jgi:hypothetical protein
MASKFPEGWKKENAQAAGKESGDSGVIGCGGVGSATHLGSKMKNHPAD